MKDAVAPLAEYKACLLYTSDAADEEDSVDLGGRRIIKKKKKGRKGERAEEDKERTMGRGGRERIEGKR
ncbi:hypothetical protein CDFC105_93855 [Clostridioides difficile]|nr:hypothetical protein CDFC105_93855 [Clostridioides difficile]